MEIFFCYTAGVFKLNFSSSEVWAWEDPKSEKEERNRTERDEQATHRKGNVLRFSTFTICSLIHLRNLANLLFSGS